MKYLKTSRLFENKKIVLEATIVTFGVIVGTILNFVSLKILTSIVSPSIYGEVAIALSFVAFSNIFFGPLFNSINRYALIAINENSFLSFENSSIKLIKLLSLFTLVVFLIVFIFLGFNIEGYKILIVCFYSIFLSYINYLNNLQSVLRERLTVTILNIFDKLLKILLPYLIVKAFVESSINVMVSYLIGVLIILSIQTIVFKYYTRNKILLKSDQNHTNNYEKDLIKFAIPFLGFGLFEWLRFGSERWSLNSFGSSELVGFYAVINQIGFQSVSLFSGIISTMANPYLFQKANSSVSDAITLNNKITTYYFVLLILGFPILYFFNFYILKLLVDSKYLTYSYLLPYMYLSGVFFNIGQMISNNFTLNLKPQLLYNPKIGTAILAIISNYYFSYKWGINGITVAIVLSMFCYMIWVILISNSLKKLNLESLNKSKFNL